MKELVDYQLSNKFELSKEAMNELKEMINLTLTTYKESLEALQSLDHQLAEEVLVGIL